MQSERSCEGFVCVCVLFLIYVSGLYFPYILLKRRLLPLSPLSSSAPTPSHFLIFFKRIIWWQDYIKPTGFLSVLLVNISTGLHEYTLSSFSYTNGLQRLRLFNQFFIIALLFDFIHMVSGFSGPNSLSIQPNETIQCTDTWIDQGLY